MSVEIGKILGTADSQPLDFWIAVPIQTIVQLDDVVLAIPVGALSEICGELAAAGQQLRLEQLIAPGHGPPGGNRLVRRVEGLTEAQAGGEQLTAGK